MDNKIRVIIADDHPLLLKGLRFTLRMDENISIIGEAKEGKAALELIEKHNPDIAILDCNMPYMSGISILKKINEQNLPTKVLFLTMHNDGETFLNALNAGAKGYILKDTVDDEILKAVNEIHNDGTFISPIMSGYLLNKLAIGERRNLTNTESRVLKLVAQNKSTVEIADELFISKRTVDRHRANICEKLNIHGNNALVKYVVENRESILGGG